MAGLSRRSLLIVNTSLRLAMRDIRLLALSHGKTELDIATWSRAVEMDEARRARIKEDADSTAASARVR